MTVWRVLACVVIALQIAGAATRAAEPGETPGPEVRPDVEVTVLRRNGPAPGGPLAAFRLQVENTGNIHLTGAEIWADLVRVGERIGEAI